MPEKDSLEIQNAKKVLKKTQYPLMILKYLCIIGMQSQVKHDLESQIKELDIYPEDRYLWKCSLKTIGISKHQGTN